MASQRCAICLATSSEQCTCDSEGEGALATVRTTASRGLAHAWFRIGCGGLLVFLSYAVFALNHYAWSGAAAWIGGFGSLLVMRGARVAIKPRKQLLQLAAASSVPPARLIR